MNQQQQRAISHLDHMLHNDDSKRSLTLLTSREANPNFREPPPDWCAGWAFAVPPACANALDCKVTARYKTATLYDDNGNPVQAFDKEGKPLFTRTGKPQWKKIKRKYLVWTQGSAFYFREGYTLHGTDQEKPVAIQVEAAQEASPAYKDIKRDPGIVRLRVFRTGDDKKTWRHNTTLTMTQDQLVRVLIGGMERPSNPGKASGQ